MYVGLPLLTVEPQTLDVEIRQRAKLTAKASGVGMENFSYKWKHNGLHIVDETGQTLEFDTDERDGGIYECIVENEYGDRYRSTAQVNVISKYCMHLHHVSTNRQDINHA